jgi:hypothetical protein
MLVTPDYRGHRIEIVPISAGNGFNAEVRIRRTLTDAKPIVETVTCLKLSAALAEQAGERWVGPGLAAGGGERSRRGRVYAHVFSRVRVEAMRRLGQAMASSINPAEQAETPGNTV